MNLTIALTSLNVQTTSNAGGDEPPNNSGPPTDPSGNESDLNQGRDHKNNNNANEDNHSIAGSSDDEDLDDDDDNQPPRGGGAIQNEPHNVPAEPVDFRTMLIAQLETYMTDERQADARLKGLAGRHPNIASWRAFLFVTEQGRHFGDASDDDCVNLWLQDSMVFIDVDRELD